MSNIQCPIQILNKKVFKMSVETVFKSTPALFMIERQGRDDF